MFHIRFADRHILTRIGKAEIFPYFIMNWHLCFIKLALARDSFPLPMCFHTFAILFVSRINSRLIMYLWCLTTQQPLLTVPNHNHIFTSSLHILFHAQFVSSFSMLLFHTKRLLMVIDYFSLFTCHDVVIEGHARSLLYNHEPTILDSSVLWPMAIVADYIDGIILWMT